MLIGICMIGSSVVRVLVYDVGFMLFKKVVALLAG
jgi:hypothetical protein